MESTVNNRRLRTDFLFRKNIRSPCIVRKAEIQSRASTFRKDLPLVNEQGLRCQRPVM